MVSGVPVSGPGNVIRARRLANGLSQQKLARLAQISVGTLRDLEQGRTRRPRPGLLERLTAALGIDGTEPEPGSTEVWPAGPVTGRPARDSDGLWLQILGPLGAWRGGVALALGPPQQRAVLALLACQADAAVHRSELVDGVWGQAPPAAAVNQVQAYVGRLRRVVDAGHGSRDVDGVLVSTGRSYRLQVGAAELDWLAFRQLVAAAGEAVSSGDPLAACARYAEALALWQGNPLADVDCLLGGPAVEALRHAWADAVDGYAGAALAAGKVEQVLPYLRKLAERDPLNEHAHAMLMRALAAVAQPAAALAVFAGIRERLDAQLGIEPGAHLADLHVRILRQELPGPAAVTGAPAGGPLPRQLPAPVRGFVGRINELQMLNGLLDQPDPGDGRSVVISAIDGTAGIGKTALAIHWAHQVAARFPDGQLYVDLRAFDPNTPPLSTADAIRGFLDALHIPSERVPAGVDAQAALYRSLLVGRRMLVVLDNAHDSAQVQPLLPASPGCLALVTSRRRLASLAVREGARLVTLDLLDQADARHLLSSRLGAARAAAEGAMIDELVRLCAGLPLALTIAAARSSATPQVPIAALVNQLRDTGQQLDALSTGDAASDLRTLFRSSYRHLSPPAQRLFRRLGPFPGPDISLPVAASLAGIPPRLTRVALEELCTAHLLTERAPHRYVLHDLLRTYATEQAEQHDDETSRRAATDRLFNHYLHCLRAADRLRYPGCPPILSVPLLPGVVPEEFTDPDSALAWCQGERGVLTAMLGHVAETAPEEYIDVRRWGVWLYFHLWGRGDDLAEARRVVLTATRPAGGAGVPAAELDGSRSGDTRYRYRQLVRLGQERGEHTARAYCLFGLVQILERQGRRTSARGFAELALESFQAIGDQAGVALALNQIGRLDILLDRPDEAVAVFRRTMELCRELSNEAGEASAAVGLGLAGHRLGDYAQAARWCEYAAELYGRLGDQDAQVRTLIHVGDARLALGQAQAARQRWRDALAVLTDPDHPHAGLLRTRLEQQP